MQLETYIDAQSVDDPSEKWKKVYARVSNQSMPPTNSSRLSSCEESLLKNWIEAGAHYNSTQAVDNSLAEDVPSSVPLLRLSKRELSNTLEDILGPDIYTQLKPKMLSLPEDDSAGGFENFNWSLSPDHINAYLEIASLAAKLLTQNRKILDSLDLCLSVLPLSENCVKTFIEKFGLKVFRRPLKEAELQEYLATYREGSGLPQREALEPIVSLLLQAPQFLYRLETEGEQSEESPSIIALTDFEIATRLSFMLLRTSPDTELLTQAKAGRLREESTLREQVDRLLLDPRAQRNIELFFNQWLRLDMIPELHYSESFKNGISTDSLKRDAIDELNWFINQVVWKNNGTFFDLFMSRISNVPSQALAQVYGLDLDQIGQATELPESSRRGLLTRAALLLAGHDEASPIHRGAFIRTQLVCDTLQTPDPKKLPPGSLLPPAFDPLISTRMRWEKKTQSAVCQSCHSKINPLGFSLGNFDGLGRYIESAPTLGANGEILNIFPVDAIATPEITEGDTHRVNGPLEMSELLAIHPKVSGCFIKQWLRYSFQRHETSSDRNSYDDLLEEMQKPGVGIRGMIVKTVLLPQNRWRKIEP